MHRSLPIARLSLMAVVMVLACCLVALAETDGDCFKLIPSGFVCGQSETSQQYTLCANCPGLPTCAQCEGPTWKIYPSIINVCDEAVGDGWTGCDEDGVTNLQPQKHFYHCDANNCYAFSHMIREGTFCTSAGLYGDECNGGG